MKPIKIILLIFFALTIQKDVVAETWNEPWQKEILKKSEFFVLATVVSNVDSIGAEIEILKYFGKEKLIGRVLISGFSLLQMTSSSGHGVHLDFEKGQTIYFLLSTGKDGTYLIPTPTSGFALLDGDKNVAATYRHSYHQALVPQEIYEKTYTDIWNYYKSSQFNKAVALEFINENVNKEPAGFEENEISTFFLQHVALETAYLLDLPVELNRLKKFIESNNFHSRVSALQLLSNSSEKEAKEYLLNYIKGKQNKNFEKVIAIWSLSRIGGNEYKEKLIAIVDDLSDDETGFGVT